jgi:hypothetical protein
MSATLQAVPKLVATDATPPTKPPAASAATPAVPTNTCSGCKLSGPAPERSKYDTKRQYLHCGLRFPPWMALTMMTPRLVLTTDSCSFWAAK